VFAISLSSLTEDIVSNKNAIDAVVARPWFYEFDLPDGRSTPSYLPTGVAQIHTTRLAMLMSALEPVAGGNWAGNTVIDVACHQGYFASHLARKGCNVLGIDARPEHIADTELIARAYGLSNLRAALHDINFLRATDLGQFDITLMLGLLYHIENPVGAIRLARALTRKACVIETQVVPNMTGVVDWGSYQFQRHMVASFGIIDETAEIHAPEASTTGICITPSYEALLFIMRAVGFKRIERINVPEGGYEQLASGKRVMVIGYVDD
jgi:ubiquinone/menaquinone biosynthesis C-methylase UbiE